MKSTVFNPRKTALFILTVTALAAVTALTSCTSSVTLTDKPPLSNPFLATTARIANDWVQQSDLPVIDKLVVAGALDIATTGKFDAARLIAPVQVQLASAWLSDAERAYLLGFLTSVKDGTVTAEGIKRLAAAAVDSYTATKHPAGAEALAVSAVKELIASL